VTAVVLEVGARPAFASALDWPGWCRSGRGEEAAIERLAAATSAAGVGTGTPSSSMSSPPRRPTGASSASVTASPPRYAASPDAV